MQVTYLGMLFSFVLPPPRPQTWRHGWVVASCALHSGSGSRQCRIGSEAGRQDWGFHGFLLFYKRGSKVIEEAKEEAKLFYVIAVQMQFLVWGSVRIEFIVRIFVMQFHCVLKLYLVMPPAEYTTVQSLLHVAALSVIIREITLNSTGRFSIILHPFYSNTRKNNINMKCKFRTGIDYEGPKGK